MWLNLTEIGILSEPGNIEPKDALNLQVRIQRPACLPPWGFTAQRSDLWP